ncbi:SDR family oxidoreductase [Frankia sp. Mgl5]|uniref:NAD(P)H-binding protein n=1 Tax=Frankia sp. Mgl5 TaxID=2933793 RepID=UPI00200E2099|nr:NAD(P)H-binding protein [Frankia sp. Mgl5]MCK9930648.1 SDR family oxidoreductase [Frankia sp. Mgl5]
MRKTGLAPAEVTAAGRNQEVLDALAAEGFRAARVELAEPAQIRDAVAGHDQVEHISGKDPDQLQQHRHIVDAATAAGLRHTRPRRVQ